MCNLVLFVFFFFLFFFFFFFFGGGGGGGLLLPETESKTPVSCLLGLAPYSLVSNNQNWNRNVDPESNSLVWLIKRQILVLLEPAFEFSTLAMETELCSLQTRSIICNVQGVAPF